MQVVVDASDIVAAKNRLRRLRSLMRIAGLYSVWILFVSTHYIDDFSGLSEVMPTDDPRHDRWIAITEKREAVLVEFLDMALSAAPYDGLDLTADILNLVVSWEPV